MKYSRPPIFNFYALFLCIMLGNVSCQKPMLEQEMSAFNISTKMDGMTVVAPPKEFPSDPMAAIKAINADWIGVIPYAFTEEGKPAVQFGTTDWQWWGETPEGATKTIQLGHEAAMKVMLKPQVYVPGSWTGAINFESDEAWKLWEADYEKYIMTFAEIAEQQNAELFCIGTEFKMSSINRPQFWEELIKKIRAVYTGQLTYAANWDEYPQITWWDQVDYIGVDAYFPLSDEAIPTKTDLVQLWQPFEIQMSEVSKKFARPILFTEFGYMSVEGCAGKTWELEADRSILVYNEQAQANAFDALYEVFWSKPYWAGGFIWKWYPNEFAGEKRMYKDYTPQNKLGAATLSKWYQK